MSAYGFTDGYTPVGDGSVSYRSLSQKEVKILGFHISPPAEFVAWFYGLKNTPIKSL